MKIHRRYNNQNGLKLKRHNTGRLQKTGILMHCWWQCKWNKHFENYVITPIKTKLLKTLQQSNSIPPCRPKRNMYLFFQSKDMYQNAHRSTLHNTTNKLYYTYKMENRKATRMKLSQHKTTWTTITMLSKKARLEGVRTL